MKAGALIRIILNGFLILIFQRKERGSGLGLASSHSIIRKHNGTITVNSKLDQGSTFIIHLPATQGKETQISNQLENLRIGSTKQAGRILVMDDEVLVREVLGSMLESLGHQVKFSSKMARGQLIYMLKCLTVQEHHSISFF